MADAILRNNSRIRIRNRRAQIWRRPHAGNLYPRRPPKPGAGSKRSTLRRLAVRNGHVAAARPDTRRNSRPRTLAIGRGNYRARIAGRGDTKELAWSAAPGMGPSIRDGAWLQPSL